MFRFPLTKRPQTTREPYSLQTLGKASRLRGANVTEGLCPYCAVGCGQLIYSKGGELISLPADEQAAFMAKTSNVGDELSKDRPELNEAVKVVMEAAARAK